MYIHNRLFSIYTKNKAYFWITMVFCLLAITLQTTEAFGEPDRFEPNDTSENANLIIIGSGERQLRNFHSETDIDWVVFFAQKDEYTIDVSPVNNNADLLPDYTLFFLNGNQLEQVCETISDGSSDQFDCPVIGSDFNPSMQGFYFIKLENSNPEVTGDLTSYTISIPGALTGEIQGFVRDAITGEPIGGATITIEGSNFSPIQSQGSPLEGLYSQLLPPLNSLTLVATHDGYIKFRTEVTFTDKSEPVDIDMVPEDPEDTDDDGDGFTENLGDCNDSDMSINPGETEVCGDGIDQDCDGFDDLCAIDIDNDGDGFTENEGDCDDSDATIHPGASEICGDGIDHDCDGFDDVCSIDIEGGFDCSAYLSINLDLPQTWSNADCMIHYINFGFSEGRPAAFDLEQYLSANADLPVNWSYSEALNHYKNFGRFENRVLAFDADEYTGLYGDLPDNLTYEAALSHYLIFGRNEGRIPSFDETAYLEIYPDLPGTWTQVEAVFHFLNFGQLEGRVYDPYDESVFGPAD